MVIDVQRGVETRMLVDPEDHVDVGAPLSRSTISAFDRVRWDDSRTYQFDERCPSSCLAGITVSFPFRLLRCRWAQNNVYAREDAAVRMARGKRGEDAC